MAQESCNLDKKEEAAEIIKPASPLSLFMNSSTNSIQEFTAKKPNQPEGKPIKEAEEKEESLKAKTLSLRVGNRCLSCRKRVGLTVFRCRCGELFCWKHRYSDIHDCSFDYKAFGRQEISKANPLVRAAKIIKI